MSERVYREAWSRHDAMSLLLREAGTAFDAGCVEALQRVLAREDGVVPARQVPDGAAREVVAH